MPLQDHINDDYTNRVADAIYLYTEQETQLRISNPLESRYDSRSLSLKLQYYNSIHNTFRKHANPYEKLSLRFMRHEIAKMKARLNPTTLNKILYSPIANRIRNFINGNNLAYARHNNTITSIERELIHAHNLQTLTASMKKGGFNFEIEGTLKKMIDQDLPEFHIRYADIHYKKADFVLHFKKIPRTDLYYFEKFDAVSRPTLDALLNNDASCTRHTFYLQDKMRFSAGEATALVNGKCVCKDTDGKETWLMLDAISPNKQSPFNKVSFDLEKALADLPIKQRENPAQYQAILQALKGGNQKEVTLIINGQALKYGIEAAPTRKTIDIMNKDNQLLDKSKILSGTTSGTTRQLMENIRLQDDVVIDLDQTPKRKKKMG